MDVRIIEGMMERIAPLIKQYTEGATQKALEPVKQSIGQVALRVGALEDLGALKGENGDPGTSITVDDVAPIINDAVVKAVALIPVPKDGERGEPGLSVTVEDVAPLIAAEVEKAVSTIPVPKDGKDGEAGRDGKDGEPGPPGDIAFAPTDLAIKVASAVRLLAESPAPALAAVVSPPPITIDLKGAYTKREFKIERDANNRVVRAIEEAPL